MNTHIIVLAAGKGTRMHSLKPKVVQPLANKPMLLHILETTQRLDPQSTNIIVGYQATTVKTVIETALGNSQTLNWVEQSEQLGTAHAVREVLPTLAHDGVSLILFGDVPLISSATLTRLHALVNAHSMALVTQELNDPIGYGRVVRDACGGVVAVVEQKDATAEQLLITEVNTGIMAVNNAHLHALLPLIKNHNAQQEYYLPDLIPLAVAQGIAIHTLQAAHDFEVQGVNNKLQLAQLERAYQLTQARALLTDGLHIIDPQRFDLRGRLDFGMDCTVDINSIFEGDVVLGNNVHIAANCMIKDSKIGDNVTIKANSIIEDSQIDADCEIGPFARIRPQTHVQQHAKIGNFVETKKSTIGLGTKVNHLSYIGDTQIGNHSNIGAGTITCNYDGVNKHTTIIGNEVRIGSNSSLVAPVTIGDKATTGAGSVVRRDVEANTLCVSTAKQKHIAGWKRPEKAND